MIIELERKIFNENNTLGNLYIDGNWFCHTLEDKVRNKMGTLINDFIKIFGKTAIPYGEYEVIVNYSNKFKRKMPLLINVPKYSGIRLHFGKTETWSEGCILVSKKADNIKQQLLFDDREAEKNLINLIEEKQKKEKIKIIIK